MTTPAPTTASVRGARPLLHVVTREKGHQDTSRCSLPFAGNVPDPRTNDAMAGLLARRSSLFGRLPGEISSGLWASSSRLTVAGTASELHRVPSWPPYRAAPSACIVGKWPGMCQLALPCGGASVYAYKPFGCRGATSGPWMATTDAEGIRYLLWSARSPETGDRPPAGSWP